MAEDAYNNKITDLQKHIPFLENMIAQLKDPKGKPREAQLTKLEAVHNMITDRNKKWKFETLLKCEEVITKLQTKVMANRLSAIPESTKDLLRSDRTISVSQTVSEIMNALKFNNARAKLNCEITTPKSPSPVRDPPVKLPPKIIPTENTKTTFKIDPNEFNIGTWKTESAVTEERYDHEKPDIYSSAAKSLISPPTKPPASIFDRLRPVVVPDTTKPLLSDADLESLRTGEDFVELTCAGADETKSKEKDKPHDLNLSKSTPRIVPVPSSKPKSAKLECPKHDASKAKALPPKVEKLKDSDMFGDLLTSIDSKILEDSKKKEGKKKEHEKKGSKRHERKEKSKADKTEPVVNIKEEKIEVKVEVPSDKPVRLADKYNPKPKKHVETTDIEKAVDDSIQKRMENDPRISLKIDIFTNSKDRNFENRDPRRRLSIMQESPPPQQQPQQQHQQQPPGAHYISPQPQRPVIELPLMRDPRRSQSRFSPPPPLISPYSQPQSFHQNFIPPAQNRSVFTNHQSRLDNYHNPNTFQQQQQQNFFNPNYQAPSLRYEQNPPSVRFEPPPPTQPVVFGSVPKKSFNPFEPLDSGRDEKDSPDYYNFNNQVHPPLQSPPPEPQSNAFQRGNYAPPARGGAKFRGGANFNQYAAGSRQDRNRFDRNNEFRRPPFSQSKTASPEVSRERTKKDEGYKYSGKDVSRTKYDEMYSKLEKDKETFVSPLESLYSDPKTSIKATIQSFKIPKKHKVEEIEPPPPQVEKQKDKSSSKAEHKNEKPAAAKAKPIEVKEEPKVKKKLETSDESNSDSVETFEEKKKTSKKARAKRDPSPPPPPLAEVGSSDSDVPLKAVVKKRSARVSAKKKPPKDSDDDSDEDFSRKSRRAKTAAKKRLIEDSDETDSDEKILAKKLTDKEKKVETRPSRHSQIKKDEIDVKTLENFDVKDVKIIVEKNIDMIKKSVKAEKKIDEAEVNDATEEHIQQPDVIKSEEEKEVKKKCEKEKEMKKKCEEEKLLKKDEEEKLPKKSEEEKPPKKGEDEKLSKKSKEPKSDVDKAKELLTETKAGSLDIDDKELIEFVLQNFKKIRQLFKKDSSSDEEDEAESKKKKKKEPEKDVAGVAGVEEEEEQPPLPPPPPLQPAPSPPPPLEESPKEEKPKLKPVVIVKKKPGPKPKGRFRKAPAVKKVVKSVGRMTRTRTATLLAAPKRPRRSELDKLHEDIKEMLMGGEVLTASVKRACTIQKDEQDDASEKSAADDENIILSKLMDSSKVDPSKLKAKGANLRVLIEKTDLAKLLINDELKKKEKGKVAGDEVVDKGEEEVVADSSVNFEPQIAFDKTSPKQQKFLKKKRRRFNWASGVIKKKKKGGLLQKAPPSESKPVDETPSDNESLAESFGSSPEVGELLYVEPNKEYYPKHGKHECKLCPFKGKFIVQHYKGMHPEHEVLISRMNPGFSQKVILESYENNYESIEAFEMLNAQRTRKKRFSYQCPFCLVKFLNENSENFYDHLSSHTGEYRFSCPYCSFKTSTGRNLRPHIMSSHNRSSENVVKPSWPAPPNYKFVFGYLCAECHYVQLNRSAVEDHVKIYHLDNQKIHKINMSAMPCEEVDDVEGEVPEAPETTNIPHPSTESGTSEVNKHIDEAIDRVIRAEEEPAKPFVNPPKKKKKKKVVPIVPQVKQLKVFDLISKITVDEPIIKVEPPDDEFPETEATLPEVQVQAETTPREIQAQAEATPPEAQAQSQATPPELPIETEVTPPVLQVETEATPPKRKSPDLNAFMCNPDLTVEEHFVEENRLKKMKEIHEIVKPSRTSIVDKLQSRLDTTASPPVELQSNPPVEPPEVPINSASVEKPPPPLVLMDRSNQKKPIESVLPKHPVTTAEALPQKKVAPISNIINRLQDKLVSEVNKLPPLTHYRNLQTEGKPDMFLRIGPVQVMLNKNFVLYACFVPTCVFCTDKQNIFETHCKVTHKDFICTFKEHNKCDVCHVKIDHDGDYISMHDAYQHLITSHDDFLKKLASKKDDGVPAEEEVPDNEKPSTSAASVISEFKLPHEVPNLISQGDDENTGAKYPFVITSVTSLAPPKKNNYEEAVTNALFEKAVASSSSAAVKCDRAKPKQDLIRPVSLSKLCAPAEPAVASTTTLTLSPLNKSKPIILNAGNVNNSPATAAKKTPVIFNKIVLTSSPSTTTPPQQPPVLLNHFIGNHQSTSGNILPRIPSLTLGANATTQGSPTKTTPTSTSPKRQIVLRDIPLKLVEKTQLRKSSKALSALLSLKKNRQLFKCPEFYCSFSTDLSIKLTKHMSGVHNFTDQALLFCLYCDYKVSCETYAIHVEVKHGHCAYGCEYCLHRTTSVYFVNFHQELQHPQLPSKVLSIPLFPTSVKAISSDATLSLRKVVLPYVCGNWGCKFKTLFTCDFVNHLASHARGLRCGQCTFQLATPNAMVAHWTIHKVYPFQCKYCLYGNKSTHGIGRHQAFCHHTLEYSVICRIFVADSTGRTSSDYDSNEDEIYTRLLKWPEDSDTPEGKNLLKIYKNLPKLSGLEKTTVAEKEDDGGGGNNKDPPIKANEIEVIQISMDDILAKQTTDEGVAEDEKRSYEEPVIITNENVDADDVDPLSFDSTLENLQKEMDEKSEEHSSGTLDETDISDSFEEENVGQEEFSGRELFKCKCTVSFLSSVQLRTHVIQCQKQKPFFCAHCTRTFKTVTGLLHHYRDHGRARFKCSLCQFKRRHQVAVRNHMKLVHNVGNVMLLPVIAKKVDIDNDDFVLRPRQGARKSTENSTGPAKPSAEEAPTIETKLIFGPNEIELLPRQPIYPFDVKCATCSYATKVKSNMVRHLQFHQTEQEVPVIAPVNPVPCLEKSEKMFDKMVNLASSSHVGGRMGGVKNEKADKIKEVENINIPAFVPVSKRFICGAENCNYLCPEEAMLRRHLTAFHSDDGVYTCHHCKIKISEEKSLNIESVMKHLKLHDCNLYQCMYCKMIYHLRYKMDRHLSEKHFDKAPNLIIIREVKIPESDPSAVLEKELSKEPKPWRCGMCKYRCTTFNDIKTHASNKHFVDAKYKCALCSYKGEVKDSFAEHFEKKHPGHQLDVIVCFYKDDEVEKPKPPAAESEAEFNTTPIWQRNKHVKHIRGILLDESNAGGKIVRTLVPKKLKSPKSLPPKKDDEEEVTTPGGAIKIAASPKRVGIFGIAETLTPTSRANQKTYKVVKRAVKSTKPAANSKAVKISEHAFETTTPDKKLVEGESSENEIIDVISCDESTNQKIDGAPEKASNEDEATPVSSSLKLVNIQTLLEDPSGSEMPGFVNIGSVIRKPASSGGEVETIEILDDADDGDSGGSSSKKRKIDLTLREINKMSKDELLAGNYMGTYGPYGSPWDGKYKCPLCEKMTCRSEKDFTVHLYRELQYGAYKCNVCGETDLSEEAIKKHYVQKHGVLNSDDIVQMGWDRQIEMWIHKVIAFQSRILKLEKKGGDGAPDSSSVLPEKTCAATDILNKIETEEDDKSKNLYCTFCDYKCKYSGDKRKHELRHWSTKPFSCDYCSYEAIYKSLIIKHIHRFHKDKEMSFHEKNTDDGVVIKPVKFLKRKGAAASQAQAKSSEEPSATLQNSKETNLPEEALLQSSYRAQNLRCFYCTFVGTLPEQTAHHETEHPSLTPKYYSYKCNYCETVFLTLVSLNAHFFSAHPGLEQSFSSVENQSDKTFRCPTCLYTSAEYSVVKYHVRSHFQPFQCLYCNERFSYWNHIQKHHYETHPASIYEYKYLLSVEKETWKEMEAIQVKKGGSYKIFTETKPAKRRKYPKKLDPTITTTTNCTPDEDDVDDDDDVMIIEDEAVLPAKLPKPNETTVKVAKKVTARKSTGVHLKPKSEGFSYYGTKPDDTNLSDIITTVEIMGASVTMYVEQLSKIFNLFPTVLVEDCGHL